MKKNLSSESLEQVYQIYFKKIVLQICYLFEGILINFPNFFLKNLGCIKLNDLKSIYKNIKSFFV